MTYHSSQGAWALSAALIAALAIAAGVSAADPPPAAENPVPSDGACVAPDTLLRWTLPGYPTAPTRLRVLMLITAVDPTRLRQGLEAFPDLYPPELFTAALAPTVADLAPYDVVIAMGDPLESYVDPVQTGDALADYVDAGGKVIQVVPTFEAGSNCELAGRFVTAGTYEPFNHVAGEFIPHTLGSYDPGHFIMNGITALSDGFPDAVTLQGGASLVASWDNGVPLVATQGSSVVAINMYPIDPGYGSSRGDFGGDFVTLFHNAMVWLKRGPCYPTFDVYFGTDNPPGTLRCGGILGLGCDPTPAGDLLAAGTTYYWKVVPSNCAGPNNQGPVWSFRASGCGLPSGVQANPGTVCTGGSTTLQATPGAGGDTVEWLVGSCDGPRAGIGNSITVSPTSTLTYYARTLDTASGCVGQCVGVSVTTTMLGVPTNLTADPPIVCAGQPSTLTAVPANGGDTIDWFNVGCSGPLVGTGTSIQVAPGQTTSYYARSRNSQTGCVGSCALIVLTVAPPEPPSQVQRTPVQICVGQSASLHATPGAGGDTIDWFADRCGGTPVGSGLSIQVSPTQTTTYYARTKNSSFGCTSTDCRPVLVPVQDVPPPTVESPTPADGATASLNMPLTWSGGAQQPISTWYEFGGSGGTSGTTRLRGNVYTVNALKALTEVKVDLSFSGTVPLYYYVLQGDQVDGTYVSILEKIVNTTGAGRALYSSGPVNCVLDPGKYYGIGVAWGSTTIGYAYHYDAGGGSVLPRNWDLGKVAKYLNVNQAPPIAGPVTPWVANTFYEFSMYLCLAQPCLNSYDVYFGIANPPTQLLCTNTIQTTCNPGALLLGTTYFWQVGARNCCGVSGSPPPVWSFTTCSCALPTGVQATPARICVGQSAVLEAIPGAGGDTLEWLAGSCTGQPFATGTPVTVTPTATTSYYVRTRDSVTGCSGSCTTLTVTVAPPSPPTGLTASPSGICPGGSSTLQGTPGAGGDTIEWFTGSCGGTLAGRGTSIQVTPTTSTTYYARSVNSQAGCSGSCSTVSVTVSSSPGVPTGLVAAPSTVCSGEVCTLQGTPGCGGDTLDWFTDSCGQTLVGTGTSIQVRPTMATTYYAWTRDSNTGRVSSCAGVSVGMALGKPTAVTASPSSVCLGQTVTLQGIPAAGGDTIEWTSGACGGNVVGIGTSIQVTPTQSGYYYARTRNSQTGCTGECTSIIVAAGSLNPPTGLTASPASPCSGQTVTLRGTPGAGGDTIEWFLGKGPGTPAGTGLSIQVTPTQSTYYYARTRNSQAGCFGSGSFIYVNLSPGAPANVKALPPDICPGQSATLSGTPATGGDTIEWFTGSCGGTLAGTGRSIPVTVSQTTTYYARTLNTQTGCAGGCTSVGVLVAPGPATGATATPSTICCGESTLLQATPGCGGDTIRWYTGSCRWDLVGTGNPLRVWLTQDTTYYAASFNSPTGQAGSTCASVAVSVTPGYPGSVLASPAYICSGQSATLQATLGTGSDSIEWFDGSCGGTPVGTGSPIQVAPTKTTTYYVRLRNSQTGCAGPCGSVRLTVGSLLSPGLTASPSSICRGQTSTLTATPGSGGDTVDWFAGACGGTPVGTSTSIQVSPDVSTTYYARTRSTTGGCAGAACGSVWVKVTPAPPALLTATPASLCPGQSTTLQGTPGLWGQDIEWFSDSCGGTLVGTGTVLQVTPAQTTTYYARSTISGCSSSICSPLSVVVRDPLPAAENPSPADGGSVVPIDVQLSWTPGVRPNAPQELHPAPPVVYPITAPDTQPAAADQSPPTADGATDVPSEPAGISTWPNIGGPDPGGYSFIDSHEPGGPGYNWIEVAQNGTNLNLSAGTYAFPINLPFDFEFYGNSYRQLAVDSSGRVYFENRSLSCISSCLPLSGCGAPRFIALYWNGLSPGGAQNVYYQLAGAAPHRVMVLQWQNVPATYSSNQKVTAQAQLHEGSSNIILLYANPPQGGIYATVGIQRDTTAYLQYSCNQARLHPGLAIMFTRGTPCPTVYDVFLSTANPPTEAVCTNLAQTNCTLAALAPETLYFWQVVPRDCCGPAVNPPVWQFTTGPQPPVITQWRSLRSHSGVGELPIVLDPAAVGNGGSGPTVEPRGNEAEGKGLRLVQVDFDRPVALADVSQVTVSYRVTSGGVMGPPTGYVPTVSLADADTMNIAFGDVPDEACYTIDIAPGALADGLTGDRDCLVRALVADGNGNGALTLADALLTKTRINAPVAASPHLDYDLNGVITLADALLARSRLNKQALCP